MRDEKSHLHIVVLDRFSSISDDRLNRKFLLSESHKSNLIFLSEKLFTFERRDVFDQISSASVLAAQQLLSPPVV